MKFSIYGRFYIDVLREGEEWIAYRSESGKRVRQEELVIPPELETHEIATYLDDVFHEYAALGQTVERVAL